MTYVMKKNYYSILELSKLFTVSRSTVYYWVHQTDFFPEKYIKKIGNSYFVSKSIVTKYLRQGFPEGKKIPTSLKR